MLYTSVQVWLRYRYETSHCPNYSKQLLISFCGPRILLLIRNVYDLKATICRRETPRSSITVHLAAAWRAFMLSIRDKYSDRAHTSREQRCVRLHNILFVNLSIVNARALRAQCAHVRAFQILQSKYVIIVVIQHNVFTAHN